VGSSPFLLPFGDAFYLSNRFKTRGSRGETFDDEWSLKKIIDVIIFIVHDRYWMVLCTKTSGPSNASTMLRKCQLSGVPLHHELESGTFIRIESNAKDCITDKLKFPRIPKLQQLDPAVPPSCLGLPEALWRWGWRHQQ